MMVEQQNAVVERWHQTDDQAPAPDPRSDGQWAHFAD